MLYAWNRLEIGDLREAGAEDISSYADLFARLIVAELERLLRRGLERGYVPYEAVIPGVRGRIDVGVTMCHQLLERGRARCRYDELSWDVTLNRVILATIHTLLNARSLTEINRDRLMAMARRLVDVTSIHLTAAVFRSVQLHRNNATYAYVLYLCRFIFENAVPNETSGTLFRDFIRDERQMRLLFQAFVRNFYDLELDQFDVGAPWFYWQGKALTSESEGYLPRLVTDMVLDSGSRTIIVETKYTPEVFRTRFVERKHRSEHLYQLFAYLLNYPDTKRKKARLEGMLLYPAVGGTFDHAYEMHGRIIRVCSVDLSQPWPKVHEQLLALTDDRFSRRGEVESVATRSLMPRTV